MTYFILQSLALLLLAYFLGCMLGCLVRRLWGSPEIDVRDPALTGASMGRTTGSVSHRETVTVRPTDTASVSVREPDVTVRPRVVEEQVSAEGSRFGRAFEPRADVPRQPPQVTTGTVRQTIPPVVEPPKPLQPQATQIARQTLESATTQVSTGRTSATDVAVVGGAAAATAVAAAAAARSREAEKAPVVPRQQPAPTPQVVIPSIAAASAGPQDDLKRIKGIGPEFERRLNALGVRRYGQIAAWASADVERFSRELIVHGRIQHENWIEQAQVLARGGDTFFSRRVDRREVPAGPGSTWSPVAPSQVERQGAVSMEAAGNQGTAGSGLAGAVVGTVASVATAAAAAAVAASPVGRAVAAAEVLSGVIPAVVSGLGGGAAAPASPAEDLKRIRGVTPEIERLLNGAGILRYTDIAGWLPADIQRLSERFGLHGRIDRESWVEQAAVLARGGETEYARRLRLAVAERDAQRQAAAATAAAAQVEREPVKGASPPTSAGQVSRSGVPDDLKRIRGISLVIEKKLARMGVASYSQIATWSEADIEQISESLGVKGNIERERWIEQARILAGGGQTDFSRRVDRGVVSPSGPSDEGKR